jgi:hypothetical protein
MEKLTLQQSTIFGTVNGKPVMSTVRASSAGLLLPAGQYVLQPPVDNPVYGLVMSIEPLPASAVPAGEISIRGMPTSGIVKTPSAAMGTPAPPIRAPAVVKFSPSIKFDSPAIKFDSPSIKFDTGAGGAAPPVVITSRPIAGNGFVVTSGAGDLFEVVRSAGGVILVVE